MGRACSCLLLLSLPPPGLLGSYLASCLAPLVLALPRCACLPTSLSLSLFLIARLIACLYLSHPDGSCLGCLPLPDAAFPSSLPFPLLAAWPCLAALACPCLPP